MAAFASEAWVDAWWSALRADDRVREAATGWVFGPWLLLVEADADAGLAESVALRIDLHQGEVRDLRLSTATAIAHTPWTFTASYARWKQLLGGKAELLDAITGGRVKATGDLPELHRHDRLVGAVFAAAAALDTAWPDDVPAEAPAPAGAR